MTYILFNRERDAVGIGSTAEDAIKDSLQYLDSEEYTENSIIESIGSYELARQFDTYEFFLFKTEISLESARDLGGSEIYALLCESVESGEFRDVSQSEIPEPVFNNYDYIIAEKILSFLKLQSQPYGNDLLVPILENLFGIDDAIDYVNSEIDETDEDAIDIIGRILIENGFAEECYHNTVNNNCYVQLTISACKRLDRKK